MTTIVLNTKNGAVTHYDWAFTSLTANRAGGAAGLHTLGGPDDAGQPIAAKFLGGRTLLGSTLRKAMGIVFVAGALAGPGRLRVRGSAEWQYDVPVSSKDVTRATTGRGIDDNYLALGFANVDGADFRIDAIEPELPQSRQRRT